MTAEDWIQHLALQPHPEGGYFRETYRSAAATAIYYLLVAGQYSRWHRVDRDELWHFYDGDPLGLQVISPEGILTLHTLGIAATPQVLVPKDHWQRAWPLGSFTLVGCTVHPAFVWEGFTLATEAEIQTLFPQLAIPSPYVLPA